jgi:hypothetical protein
VTRARCPSCCVVFRAFTCVDSIGALRNIANDPAASNEAGELGAVDALVDVIRTNAASVSLGAGDAWAGMPGGRCSPRGVRCGR